MTQAMLTALQKAQNCPLRRIHAEHGKPHWPAHPSTLAALVRLELMRRDQRVNRKGRRIDEWIVTDAGREVLKPKPVKVRRLGPLYVSRGWPDYTGDIGRAMPGEPEAVRPQDVDALWFGAAAERHAIERDRRTAARRVARAA